MLTLDDYSTRQRALRDPDQLIRGISGPCSLDEVQRAPELMSAITRSLALDSSPGRFLISSSVDLDTLCDALPRDWLVLYRLYPLSWAELEGHPSPGGIETLLGASSVGEVLARFGALEDWRPQRLHERILGGGLPVPARERFRVLRDTWFDTYCQTYFERKLPDVVRLRNVSEFIRLFGLVARRSGQILSGANMARQADLPLETTRRFLGYLEATHLVWLLPAFTGQTTKRLVKAPKLFLFDSGLAAHLGGCPDWESVERQGVGDTLTESFIALEVAKIVSRLSGPVELAHWRTHAGAEVDLVVGRGQRLLPLDISWSSRIGRRNISGIKAFLREHPDRAPFGVILYPGDTVQQAAERVVALPYESVLLADGYLSGGV